MCCIVKEKLGGEGIEKNVEIGVDFGNRRKVVKNVTLSDVLICRFFV